MTAAEGADPAEVERLAQVACGTDALHGGYRWDGVHEAVREAYRAIVRAVLAAQQQPPGDDRGGHWEYGWATQGYEQDRIEWHQDRDLAEAVVVINRGAGVDCRVIRRWVGGWQEDA